MAMSIRLLLLDVNNSFRIKQELSRLGYPVDIASSVGELFSSDDELEPTVRTGGGIVVVADRTHQKQLLEIVRRIDMETDEPLVLVTPPMGEADRLTVLRNGATVIIENSLPIREIALRIDRLLDIQRIDSVYAPAYGEWTLGVSHLVIDDDIHKVFLDDEYIRLTETEWRLLRYLAYRAGAICAREAIIRESMCYDDAGPYLRSLDAHIKNLRKKLKDQPWIETVRGFGYQFVGERINEDEK
jgi:two-component system response regulator ResD